MVTTQRLTPATRSIAPPMPFTSLPGTIQLARSPFRETSIAPRIARSICPPRIMRERCRADEKNEVCGKAVTVCLPALIRSASTSASSRERAHAQHAVFGLQGHMHAVGDVVGDQRRNADAEVDIEAVAQFLRGACGHLVACPGHLSSPAQFSFFDGALLDALFVSRGLRRSAARRCPACGCDRDRGCRRRHQLLDLGHRHLAGRRHHRIEIARGLAEHQIALGVALPRLDDGKVGLQPASPGYRSPRRSPCASLPSAISVPTPVLV